MVGSRSRTKAIYDTSVREIRIGWSSKPPRFRKEARRFLLLRGNFPTSICKRGSIAGSVGNAAVSPNDFNPFAEKPQKIVLKGAEMLDALKAAFIRNRKPY